MTQPSVIAFGPDLSGSKSIVPLNRFISSVFLINSYIFLLVKTNRIINSP